MLLEVGCTLNLKVEQRTPTVLLVEPRLDQPARLLAERWVAEPEVARREASDPFGNRRTRLVLPAGAVELRYQASVEAPDEPDPADPGAVQHPVEELPDDVLAFTLPSRYALSDELMGQAWDLFGALAPGWARVTAVCEWVNGHLGFRYGSSNPLTTAVDVFEAGEGVCRDFAHLAVSFCRALNVPTRYAFGYLPDIGVPAPPDPMDFCAWIEVYLGGRWWTFDPRNQATMPRRGRVLIGRGRDAVDVAMITTYGLADLTEMKVVAQPSASPES
jgi:transglutaminase-like putative cysteine protease